ncbi:MAG: DUF1345 domain-containing protein [Candidatus Saccharimonadales bacterium]
MNQVKFALLISWDVTALIYAGWVWLTVLPMDSKTTKSHAVRENPGRALADVLLLVASVASLGTIVFLIVHAGSGSGNDKVIDILLGLISVIVSWAMVHTTFALRYARLYYSDVEGGIDFNGSESPKYSDFAYLAFTIGMTYQVSDTSLQTKELRSTALRHAMLSYLFGTVIIVTTINTLATLSQ